MMRAMYFNLTALMVLTGLVNTAGAVEPIAMHVGSEIQKMTREVCAQKAVEAMGVREKFPFAEITADGNARGWNDTTSVLVLSFPTPAKDRLLVVVVTAGKDNQEAERLRNALRSHISEAPHNPDTPRRIAPEAGELPPRAAWLCWKSEERNAIHLLRFYEAVATLVLEKRGFTTNPGGKNLVFGGFPGRSVAAFLAPTSSGLSVQLNVVSATSDEDTRGEVATELLSRIVNVIYEE